MQEFRGKPVRRVRCVGAGGVDRLVVAFYRRAEPIIQCSGPLSFGIKAGSAFGEHDRHSVVWDYVAVYPFGAVWGRVPHQRFIKGIRWFR